MVGHPEWMEERTHFLDRTALAPTIDAWVAEHTVAEVTDLASAFRIPNAPIVDGANAAAIDHFVQRGTFVDEPTRRRARTPPRRTGCRRLPSHPAGRRHRSASTPPTPRLANDAPMKHRGQAPNVSRCRSRVCASST